MRRFQTKIIHSSQTMPLSQKGAKIMASMMKEYGAKKGKKVFYASQNKGVIKGVEKAKHHKK